MYEDNLKNCDHVNTNGPPDAARLLQDITPKPPSCLCKWGHKPNKSLKLPDAGT